jgi:hypothetical protein
MAWLLIAIGGSIVIAWLLSESDRRKRDKTAWEIFEQAARRKARK